MSTKEKHARKWNLHHKLNYEFAQEYIEYMKELEPNSEVEVYEYIGAKV